MTVYGYHERFKIVESKLYGTDFDGTSFTSYDHSRTAIDKVTAIQPPQRGNFKTAGPIWQRSEFELVADEPRIVKSVEHNDKGQTKTSYFLQSLLVRDNMGIVPHYPDLDNSIAQSITKSLSNLQRNSQQLGANIGEGKQVINMFSSNASQIAAALLAAKRGDWASVPGHLGMSKKDVLNGKFAANKWLEYSYGWKPLFSDLVSAQQKVHEVLVKDSYVRAKATSEKNGVTSIFNKNESRMELTTSSSARTVIIAKLARPTLASVASWGLINPLSIAWELAPFSFVVDWFVPVGNTLNALTAGVGLEFVDGWTTYKNNFTYSATDVKEYSGTDSSVERGYALSKGYDFVRYPRFNFPTPQLYADLTPFSTQRALNAAALVRQLL